MKILVAEDDPLIRRALRDLLNVEGIELLFASSQREGLELLRKNPDLVFCDLAMHEKDGFALIEAIRAKPEWHALPIVVLSSKTSRSDLHLAMEIGADDYITKPLQASELIKVIKTQMARIKPRSEKPKPSEALLEGHFSMPLTAEVLDHLRQIEEDADLLLSRAEQLDPRQLHEIGAKIQLRAHMLNGIVRQLLRQMQLEQQSRQGETLGSKVCEAPRFADNAC